MNALIVEDEKSSALRLAKLIGAHSLGKTLTLYFANSVTEARIILNEKNIELMFLDLQLSNEDGFKIIKEITAESFFTIIVSAYIERAIEAYEYGIFDFIPKPVFQERLDKCLEKLFGEKRSNTFTKKISIKNKNSIEIIDINDIVYFLPADHYTEIRLANGSKKLHHLSLDKIIKILPNNFERIHRSYIVNVEFINKIYSHPGSKYEVELRNKMKLPLSRSYAKAIKKLFYPH